MYLKTIRCKKDQSPTLWSRVNHLTTEILKSLQTIQVFIVTSRRISWSHSLTLVSWIRIIRCWSNQRMISREIRRKYSKLMWRRGNTLSQWRGMKTWSGEAGKVRETGTVKRQTAVWIKATSIKLRRKSRFRMKGKVAIVWSSQIRWGTNLFHVHSQCGNLKNTIPFPKSHRHKISKKSNFTSKDKEFTWKRSP